MKGSTKYGHRLGNSGDYMEQLSIIVSSGTGGDSSVKRMLCGGVGLESFLPSCLPAKFA